ncbi:hypothetical protein E2C01_031211 [Portunus trituberculatus]|uniref:Uncharacterized protein n=1 Tax=Portunus trituberculatus TaxID=210409 RepID=A0A5B7ESV8_PORTR|nr:hypothetical protein [Portunus trituberculatus]
MYQLSQGYVCVGVRAPSVRMVVIFIPFMVTVTCPQSSFWLQSILLCQDIPEVMSNEGQENLDVHRNAMIGPG